MKKLRLQMQISIDGFVAREKGELDWMTWNMDEKLIGFITQLTDSSDTILMGRKMTDGFISSWSGMLENPDSPEYTFAKKMIDIPKVVFTRTLTESPWINTTLAHDLVADIKNLKQDDGKDIIAYGGAGFVTSLIRENLIDDYYLFVNPIAISKGMTIFSEINGNKELKLVESTPYDCGIIVNHYQPTK
jgi:dihydrofolate reductase